MARLNDLGQGKVEAPKLDPLIIKIRPGFNYRDMNSPQVKAHIDWLEKSIADRGVQDPIEVEYIDGVVYLVDGECRLRAAQRLRKRGVDLSIPAVSVRGDEADVLARAMIANGSLPPTLLEFGKGAARLVGYGWDMAKIAALVPPAVSNGDAKKALKFAVEALEINDAPLDVKKAVAEGVDGVSVSPALAVAVTRKNRIQAGEIIREEAARAKAAGKKVASRPKGAGKVTRAKAAAAEANDKLLRVGDRMAAGILDDRSAADVDWLALERLAKSWQKQRGA